MTSTGLFVSIDGPGGSGKSRTAALAREQLTALGLPVHATTEPSRTTLGNLIRASTYTYQGMSLACLVAGDRHHHLSAEIRPQLHANAIVISDRYLPSSLVLQRMDGLTWETIWQLNAGADTPDLAVIMTAEPTVLTSRLAERGGAHSRFEDLPDGSAAEYALYHEAAARLTALGWPVCQIDNTSLPPADAAAIVTDRVLALRAERKAS